VDRDSGGLQHRTMLCMPIRDDDRVLGVISLINKEDTAVGDARSSFPNKPYFTANDERFVEAFSYFCGMAIKTAAEYEKAVVSEAKLQGLLVSAK